MSEFLKKWVDNNTHGSEEVKRWAIEKLAALPRGISGGLIRRVLYGFRCGDFLEGVISGDLDAVMTHADSLSIKIIPEVYRAVRGFPGQVIKEFKKGALSTKENACHLSDDDRAFLVDLIKEI